MAEWTQCPSCKLKHMTRSDGLCPRCRQPIAVGWGSAATASASSPPVVAPSPAVAVVPPPSAGAHAAAPGETGTPYAFTVGRFVGAVFSTWGRTAGWIVPVSLIVYAAPAIALYRLYGNISLAARGQQPDPISMLVSFSGVFIPILVLTPLERAAIARAGVRRLQGERIDLGDMLGTALRAYFPTLALLLVVGLAFVGTACTLFVIPLMLLTAWSASLPAMLTERLGPIEALKRSWELTRGLRWQVFAGFLVVILALLAIACVLQSLLTAVVIGAAVGTGAKDPALLMGTMSVVQAANMLLQGVYTSFYTVGTAVAYHQLRVAAEGPPTQSLATVFE